MLILVLMLHKPSLTSDQTPQAIRTRRILRLPLGAVLRRAVSTCLDALVLLYGYVSVDDAVQCIKLIDHPGRKGWIQLEAWNIQRGRVCVALERQLPEEACVYCFYQCSEWKKCNSGIEGKHLRKDET